MVVGSRHAALFEMSGVSQTQTQGWQIQCEIWGQTGVMLDQELESGFTSGELEWAKNFTKAEEKVVFFPSFIQFHHSKCGVCCHVTIVHNEKGRIVGTHVHLSCVILRQSTQGYIQDQYKHGYMHVKAFIYKYQVI